MSSHDLENAGVSLEQPIELRYRLSFEQFMAACNKHWEATRVGSRVNLAIGSIGLLLGAFLLLGQQQIFWGGVVCIGVSCVLILLIPMRYFNYRRFYYQTSKYANEIELTLTTDQMRFKTAGVESKLDWSFYSRYLETPDAVLLYYHKRMFSILPKSAFSSDQELGRFMRFVKGILDPIR